MAKTIREVKNRAGIVNVNCSNGFRFDEHACFYRNESVLQKSIEVRKGVKVAAKLYFRESYNRSVRSKENTPVLHVSTWYCDKEQESWSSHGIGYFHLYEDKIVSRKSIKVLQDLTAKITDEFILELADKKMNDEHRGVLAE